MRTNLAAAAVMLGALAALAGCQYEHPEVPDDCAITEHVGRATIAWSGEPEDWAMPACQSPELLDDDGDLACVMYETLSPGARCEEVPGRDFDSLAGAERERCLVARVPEPDAESTPRAGWFLLVNPTRHCEGPAIAFTDDAGPLDGSRLELRCAVPLRSRGSCE